VIDDDVRARASRRTREVRQDVGQLTEPQLGGSTTAPGVLGEAEGGARFGGHPDI
jgi:hypothetical protein